MLSEAIQERIKRVQDLLAQRDDIDAQIESIFTGEVAEGYSTHADGELIENGLIGTFGGFVKDNRLIDFSKGRTDTTNSQVLTTPSGRRVRTCSKCGKQGHTSRTCVNIEVNTDNLDRVLNSAHKIMKQSKLSESEYNDVLRMYKDGRNAAEIVSELGFAPVELVEVKRAMHIPSGYRSYCFDFNRSNAA